MSSFSTADRRPPRPTERSRAGGALALGVFLVVLAAIAAFEGTVGSASDWFSSSAQVVWTPPHWLSRSAWAGLFLLLAVAGWLIWRSTLAAVHLWPRVLYVVSLALLTVWPPIYLDGYLLIGTAALWIAFGTAFLLVLALVALIASTWNVTRTAAVLLILAAAWVLYVATINFGDAILASLA
jgi:benzodiazapine receptor